MRIVTTEVLVLALPLILAWCVLLIVANWRIFEKAGQPGWASLVPFYANYIEYKIHWGNGWLFLVPVGLALLSFIPFIGIIFNILQIVIAALNCYKRAEAFGQGIGFAIGVFFLGPIFNIILAFGRYRYFGVPQDGFSYDQLKSKWEGRNASSANVNYQNPPVDSAAQNVRYNQPDNNNYYNQNAYNQNSGAAYNPGQNAVPAPRAGARFCPQCGSACQQGDHFCKNCGTKLI